VGSRAVLDAVVKRKILSPRWESKPRTPIVHPIAGIGCDSVCVYEVLLALQLKLLKYRLSNRNGRYDT
jgi:hypothetical protein